MIIYRWEQSVSAGTRWHPPGGVGSVKGTKKAQRSTLELGTLQSCLHPGMKGWRQCHCYWGHCWRAQWGLHPEIQTLPKPLWGEEDGVGSRGPVGPWILSLLLCSASASHQLIPTGAWKQELVGNNEGPSCVSTHRLLITLYVCYFRGSAQQQYKTVSISSSGDSSFGRIYTKNLKVNIRILHNSL